MIKIGFAIQFFVGKLSIKCIHIKELSHTDLLKGWL